MNMNENGYITSDKDPKSTRLASSAAAIKLIVLQNKPNGNPYKINLMKSLRLLESCIKSIA